MKKNVLSSSDFVIIYNSYEWFTNPEDLKSAWEYTLGNIKTGAYIITSPSIQTSFDDGGVNYIDIDSYVSLVDSNEENEIFFYLKL